MKRPQVKLFNPYSILEEVYDDINFFYEKKARPHRIKAKMFLDKIISDRGKDDAETYVLCVPSELVIQKLYYHGYITKYICDEDHFSEKLITVVW